MSWDALREQLAAEGFVEFVEDSPNVPYLSSCLHSLECTGPTFFHFFGRRLEIKVITRCADCGRIKDLTPEKTNSVAHSL